MLVQATNGAFYKNPVFYGTRSMATCHDFGAHVCVAGKMGVNTARSRASASLCEMQIAGKLLEGEGGKFMFGSDYTEGWKFDFVFRGATPIPRDFYFNTPEPAKGQLCSGFWSSFWENEVVEHLAGLLILPLLQRALLGDWIDDRESLLKRRLFRQWPDLRGQKTGMAVRRKLEWTHEELS